MLSDLKKAGWIITKTKNMENDQSITCSPPLIVGKKANSNQTIKTQY